MRDHLGQLPFRGLAAKLQVKFHRKVLLTVKSRAGSDAHIVSAGRLRKRFVQLLL
jgi:hypothetical protein